MKRLICFLLLVLLCVPLCSCKDNTTEVSAIKVDIISIMEDLAELRKENEELQAEILSLKEMINSLYHQINSEPDSPPITVSSSGSSNAESTESSCSPIISDDLDDKPSTENEDSSHEEYPTTTDAVSPPSIQHGTVPVEDSGQENSPQMSEVTDVTTVFITKSGSKYHFSSNCGNGTYFESSLEEALAKGLTPCKKCAK